ncbi:uncharacterized protein LOC124164288 isoform X2 [Ischnura elegans]|uniref:uncharacterized protein LOC124164288 isoform X2 n=1 Tax=Ischnura elegans TaxID=197161 RepID=UPI001ED86DDF|nr:uncharacterized protein LOC124164288 isoform X2 [Ischnura elegans]
MTSGFPPPCGPDRGNCDPRSPGCNTVSLNIDGENVNIDFSQSEACVIGGEKLRQRWDGDFKWHKEPFTPNKDLPCIYKPPPREKPPDEDEHHTATTSSESGDGGGEGRRGVGRGGDGDGCMRAMMRCSAGEKRVVPEKAPPATPPPTRRTKKRKAKSSEEMRWEYTGPPWYTELSDVQVKVLESLNTDLKMDIEEGRRVRTLKALRELGVSPMPTRGQVHASMVACIEDVKKLRKQIKAKEESRLGNWSKYEDGSCHVMEGPEKEDEEQAAAQDETLLTVYEYDEPEVAEEEASWHCKGSTTPPTDASTKSEYSEACPDICFLPETRWCEWCGECNTHCPAFLPPPVCEEEDGESKEEGDKESDECLERCDWCGACSDHCPSTLPPPCQDEQEEEETAEEDAAPKCDWCGNCTGHCPAMMLSTVCEESEEEGEGEGEDKEDLTDGEEEGGEGGEEVEGEGGERDEAEGDEEGVVFVDHDEKDADDEAEEKQDGDDSTEGSSDTKYLTRERKITVRDPTYKHVSLRYSVSATRRLSRAPLQVILPFKPGKIKPKPLEIEVNAVEFLMALYMATGGIGGRTENEAKKLKGICKRMTRRLGKSPYLTYCQVDVEEEFAVDFFGHKESGKKMQCRHPKGQMPPEEVKEDAILIQILEALRRVHTEHGDPIACLPFAWKLPGLRLWIDKRRRKSAPQFASLRPKMTRMEIDKMLEFSKSEWNYLRVDSYNLERPKIPKSLERIQGFSMAHFKKGRKQGEKMREIYIDRFKKIVLESNRDYWPTMCPYASLPVPWDSTPQMPPHPPPERNFKRAYNIYLPAREKDIYVTN